MFCLWNDTVSTVAIATAAAVALIIIMIIIVMVVVLYSPRYNTITALYTYISICYIVFVMIHVILM